MCTLPSGSDLHNKAVRDRGRWKVTRRPSLALFKNKTCLCWLQQQVSQQPCSYCSERAVRVPGRSCAGFCHFLFSLLHGYERGGHPLVKFAKGRNASSGWLRFASRNCRNSTSVVGEDVRLG